MSAQPQPAAWASAPPRPAHAELRVLPIPATEPAPSGYVIPPPENYVQGVLAVDFRRTFEDSYFGPQATTAHDLPDPADWAGRLLRVLLEVGDGTRPAGQLSRWVTAEILDRFTRRGVLARRRLQRQRPVRVRTLRVCQPADGVAEVAAVVDHGGRVRAVAARLCGVDGRWLMTALEMG